MSKNTELLLQITKELEQSGHLSPKDLSKLHASLQQIEELEGERRALILETQRQIVRLINSSQPVE